MATKTPSMTKGARSKRLAKQVRSGKSMLGDIGAAARKTVATRNGPKASEKDNLQPKLFGGGLKGKHHAPSNSKSVERNANPHYDVSVGKHAAGWSSSPTGRHAGAGMGSPANSSSGLSYVGRHRKG